MRRYLPVEVYGVKGRDCTNGGVTSTHANNLVVPCPDGHITHDELESQGYVVLELQSPNLPGYPCKFIPKGETRRTMFGGHYVSTSDSRFGKMYGHSPIKVHDRIEE